MKRVMFSMIVAVALAACGGAKSQQSADDTVTETPESPADPMVAACEAGTARSCLIAGENAERRGEPEEAARLWATACELGEASGCALSGGVYANSGDVPRGTELLEKGCELDEPTSCYGAALARMGMFGGEPQPAEAAGLFERGCSLGLASACGALAELLEKGNGVEADPERASALRRQACDEGDGASCSALAAQAIASGDVEKGTTLLEKACETDGAACTRRGLVALQKEQEPATAREFFEKGCTGEFADVEGCAWMGWLVYDGIGGEADPERGSALISGACDADSPTGCMFLAVTRARGGDAEAAGESMTMACELAPDQCDALRVQYERLIEE